MPKLLVSACSWRDGGVFLLDPERGALTRLSDLPTRGLTLGPDAPYGAGGGGEIFSVDVSAGTCRRLVDLPLRGVHDIRWDGRHFHIVASLSNEVVRLDRDLKTVESFRVVDSEDDVCHANCLHVEDGRMLLSVFTLSPGTRDQKRLTDVWRSHGKVLELVWETHSYRVLFEPLAQPHSLVAHAGKLYCCESHSSRVVEMDLAKGTRRTAYQGRGFIRGLSFVGDRVYVGVSRNRQGGFLQKLTRSVSHGAVLELDAATWALRREFPVPASQVYEILALPE